MPCSRRTQTPGPHLCASYTQRQALETRQPDITLLSFARSFRHLRSFSGHARPPANPERSSCRSERGGTYFAASVLVQSTALNSPPARTRSTGRHDQVCRRRAGHGVRPLLYVHLQGAFPRSCLSRPGRRALGAELVCETAPRLSCHRGRTFPLNGHVRTDALECPAFGRILLETFSISSRSTHQTMVLQLVRTRNLATRSYREASQPRVARGGIL